MYQNKQSPIVGYYISMVSNPSFDGISFSDKWLPSSIRLARAVRKARKTPGAVMLFGQRKNGEFFPVSFWKKRTFDNVPAGGISHNRTMTGEPIAVNTKG